MAAAKKATKKKPAAKKKVAAKKKAPAKKKAAAKKKAPAKKKAAAKKKNLFSLSRQRELEYFTVFPVSQYLRCCGAVFQYFRHAKQVFLLQYCMLPAHGPWPSIPISRKRRPSIGGANTSLPRG